MVTITTVIKNSKDRLRKVLDELEDGGEVVANVNGAKVIFIRNGENGFAAKNPDNLNTVPFFREGDRQLNRDFFQLALSAAKDAIYGPKNETIEPERQGMPAPSPEITKQGFSPVRTIKSTHASAIAQAALREAGISKNSPAGKWMLDICQSLNDPKGIEKRLRQFPDGQIPPELLSVLMVLGVAPTNNIKPAKDHGIMINNPAEVGRSFSL